MNEMSATSTPPLSRIVLGVTGGIAAYKSAELVRLLVKGNVVVDVVLTEAGAQFVTATTFQALSGRPVLSDLGHSGSADAMGHIALSRGADAILVAPASADFIAKIAHGIADDLLSTLCLARDCPLLVAPAMNRQMWWNKATQRNVAQLAADGIIVLGPDTGELACKENAEDAAGSQDQEVQRAACPHPAADARYSRHCRSAATSAVLRRFRGRKPRCAEIG